MAAQFYKRTRMGAWILGILLMSLCSFSSNAQTFDYEKEKATDKFEFDDYGALRIAKKTFPNGVILEYNYEVNSGVITVKYIEKNIIAEKSVDRRNSEHQPVVIIQYEDPNSPYWEDKVIPVNDWYKQYVLAISEAPNICDALVFGFSEFDKVMFTLNSGVKVEFGKYGDQSVSYPNGDFFSFKDEYSCRRIIKSIKKDFGNYKVIYAAVDGNSGMDHIKNVGSIVYNNGTVFKGRIKAIPIIKAGLSINEAGNPNNRGYGLIVKDMAYTDDSNYMALGEDIYEYVKHQQRWTPLMIDDIESVIPYDGFLYDSQDKILDIYKDGGKLDEFDKMSIIAEEQGKVDREKKAIADAISKKESIYKYYGNTYADAFYAGDIIIGMPEDLFLNGVKGHVFKKFWMANPSIISGNDTCYDLYKFDIANPTFEQVGYLWVGVKNGKRVITSIVYY